jgi:hypothetical protein
MVNLLFVIFCSFFMFLFLIFCLCSLGYFLVCDLISNDLILFSLWICVLMILARQSVFRFVYFLVLFLVTVLGVVLCCVVLCCTFRRISLLSFYVL